MDDLQKAHPISIHSARVGGDLSVQSARSTQPNFNPLRPCGRRPTFRRKRSPWCRFQSTPPVWAETITLANMVNSRSNFNPLRPCGRRPNDPLPRLILVLHFNPLRPCGRRPHCASIIPKSKLFQSTPPVWAETNATRTYIAGNMIFQSTPPVWAETFLWTIYKRRILFQSTPPVWAETC